jgi:hypothetical protein
MREEERMIRDLPKRVHLFGLRHVSSTDAAIDIDDESPPM